MNTTDDISQYTPASGEALRDDSSRVNLANAAVPRTIVGGQNASVGTSAGALAASAACSMVFLQAASTNTAIIYWGGSAAQYNELYAGMSVAIPIDDISKIYVKSASGTQKANYNKMS